MKRQRVDSDSDNNSVNETVSIDSNEIDYPHKCAICNKKFKRLSDILPHVDQMHSDFLKKKSNAKKIPGKSRKSPRKRSVTIKTKITAHKHSIKDTLDENESKNNEREKSKKSKSSNFENKCSMCDQTYANKASLRSHKNNVHRKKEPFSSICNICGELFTSALRFDDHYKRHFPEQCLQCKICNKIYTRKNQFNHHMLIHSGKEFKCDICGHLSATKQLLMVFIYSKFLKVM